MHGTDRSTRAGSEDGFPAVALPAGVVRVGLPGTAAMPVGPTGATRGNGES